MRYPALWIWFHLENSPNVPLSAKEFHSNQLDMNSSMHFEWATTTEHDVTSVKWLVARQMSNVWAVNCQSEQSRSACQCKNGLFIFAGQIDRNSVDLQMKNRREQNIFGTVTHSRSFDTYTSNECSVWSPRTFAEHWTQHSSESTTLWKKAYFDIAKKRWFKKSKEWRIKYKRSKKKKKSQIVAFKLGLHSCWHELDLCVCDKTIESERNKINSALCVCECIS